MRRRIVEKNLNEHVRQENAAYRQIIRTRMAVAYINQAGPRDGDRQEDMKLHAFMAIFHPEVPTQTVREMSWDMRDRRRAPPVMQARRKK